MFSVLTVTVIGSLVASLLPERAMSSTMQIAMIVIGLRFLLKPVNATRGQMEAVSPKNRLIKAIVGHLYRLYLWLCGRRRRYDDAVCADHIPRLPDAYGSWHKRVHYDVYSPDGRYQPFYH